MGRKLGTSDLHLGHSNIVKFTKRIEAMDRDGFIVPHALRKPYFYGTLSDEMRKTVTDIHDSWLSYNLAMNIDDGDVVYHLGDFNFTRDRVKLREFLTNLSGDWNFILGNHDNESLLREMCKGTRHKVLGHYHEIKVNGVKVCLLHYPMAEWNNCHRGSWHFHGHLHGTKGHGDYVLQEMERRMDLGLDAHPDHGIFDLEELVV